MLAVVITGCLMETVQQDFPPRPLRKQEPAAKWLGQEGVVTGAPLQARMGLQLH